MIVVRDIFQIKFGRMREVLDAMKEASKLMVQPGREAPRILTDLTGAYYTLVMEGTFKSLAEYEQRMREDMPRVRDWYQKFVPLVDSGRREIFTVVE